MLHPPSPEQRRILDILASGESAHVNAVAGAGKTTTILHIARAFPDKTILQLTYNKSLALDTRNRAVDLEAVNLTICTFHAFATRHWNNPNTFTDEGMLRITKYTPLRYGGIPHYDVIVFDEAQDMKFVIYGVLKLLLHHAPAAQILVLGDVCQGVYAFSGTDTRFLTLAPQLFPRMHDWRAANLSTTYRLTHEIAAFVNNHLCGDARQLVAIKSGPPVIYYRGNGYLIAEQIGAELVRRITAGTAAPADIFVLARSVRSGRAPVKHLENKLVRAGIPCYAPASDDSTVTEHILAEKVVFSSFHQSKGRERPIVVCFDFDTRYYANAAACPAELYVGATRSSRELIIVQACDPLPFMLPIGAAPYVMQRTLGLTNPKPLEPQQSKAVTKLLRFVRPEVIVEFQLHEHFTQLRPPQRQPCEAAAATEETADLTGIAIPMLYEYRTNRQCPIRDNITSHLRDVLTHRIRVPQPGLVVEIAARAPTVPDTIEAALRIANVYTALTSGLYHRGMQLVDYDWLHADDAELYLDHLQAEINGEKDMPIDSDLLKMLAAHSSALQVQDVPTMQYEANLARAFGNMLIHGRADLITPHTVYELKCTSALSSEHKLQLLVYAALAENSIHARPRYRLLNMLTGELYDYKYNHAHATKTVQRLIDEITSQPDLTTKEFLHVARLYPPHPLYNDHIIDRMTYWELFDAAVDTGYDTKYVANLDIDELCDLLRAYRNI